MIQYRSGVDVLAMLASAGWSSYRIRQEHILGERAVQKLRDRKLPSWQELDRICSILRCHPCDLLEYIPPDAQQRHQETTSSPSDTD